MQMKQWFLPCVPLPVLVSRRAGVGGGTVEVAGGDTSSLVPVCYFFMA